MILRRVQTLSAALALTCCLAMPSFAQTATAPKDAKTTAKNTKKDVRPKDTKKDTKKDSKSRASKPAEKPGVPTMGGAEPSLVGQYANWGAYVASPGGKKVCFALSKPTSSKTTPNRPRDPAYAFVSTRPAEKVTNEVSIMIGYQLKPGADSTLEIGNAKYAMYAQGDGLWIKNAAEEERMVEALRKGSDAVVKGVSSKGTASTDTFSLKGLAQALDRVAQECRK